MQDVFALVRSRHRERALDETDRSDTAFVERIVRPGAKRDADTIAACQQTVVS